MCCKIRYLGVFAFCQVKTSKFLVLGNTSPHTSSDPTQILCNPPFYASFLLMNRAYCDLFSELETHSSYHFLFYLKPLSHDTLLTRNNKDHEQHQLYKNNFLMRIQWGAGSTTQGQCHLPFHNA